MNVRVEKMRNDLLGKRHHAFRRNIPAEVFSDFAESCKTTGMTDMQRAARRLAFVLGMEKPVVFPGERIAFTRTVCTIPEILTVGEWNTCLLYTSPSPRD